jgi:chromosome segregation ATPase
MQRTYMLGILLVGCGLFTTLGGCSHLQNKRSAETAKIAELPAGGEYSKQISEQEETVRTASDASKRMRAHLRLARLFADYDNPQRNYKKALEHLEIYASLQVDFVNDRDLRNWLSALKHMDRQRQEIDQLSGKLDQSQANISKLKNKNKRLQRDTARIKKTNQQLSESNQALEETIEMLKNIDRHIEEKRKSYTGH